MSERVGIILAGGSGSRLRPITNFTTKQFLPIYDKPLIFYSISTLINAGIREILIILNDQDLNKCSEALGNGEDWGVEFHFAVQKEPKGIAEAFLIGDTFINNRPSCLILGDNIFHGSNVETKLSVASKNEIGAGIFVTKVRNPERFGILNYYKNGKPKSIVEKPKNPKSSSAVTGLYFYDKDVVEIAKKLKPSPRGELEITDINRRYLSKNKLNIYNLSSSDLWLDAGTFDSLAEATDIVKTFKNKNNAAIGSPELAALKSGFISTKEYKKLIKAYGNVPYANWLEEKFND